MPMLQNIQILYLTNFITSVGTRIACCSMSVHLKWHSGFFKLLCSWYSKKHKEIINQQQKIASYLNYTKSSFLAISEYEAEL